MSEYITEIANDIAKSCPDLVENGCGNDNCVACLAFKLIGLGYQKQEWISVEERLPDKTQDYLVVLNGEDIDIRLFNSRNEPYQTYSSMMNKFLFFDTRGDWHTTYRVTHWMPLPEAPKMKGDEGK